MNLVITVGGLHGTGKSTYAKLLAEDLELRHISAGELFRAVAKEKKITLNEMNKLTDNNPEIDNTIDQRIKQEANKGNVILDGQLAAWMAGDKTVLKILLIAPKEVRLKRIAQRDGISLKEAEKRTLYREQIEKERYKRYYGIDVSDPSIYDLIVDTNLYPFEEMKKIIKKIVGDYVKEITKRKK
jgi:cytidylate kinase